MPDFKTKFQEMDPIVKGFIYRRQVTLIAGAPYAGKTSCVYKKLAVPIAVGAEDLLGGANPPRKVLICSERDWEFNSAQMKTLGITELPPNLKIFCYQGIPKKDKSHFDDDPLGYVASIMIDDSFRPDLTILDTSQLFQSRCGSKTINDYTSARKEMAYIKDWAVFHNTGLLANFHAPKQNAKNSYDDPFDKVLGSTAFLAATVAAAIMERCNDSFVRMHLKSHVDKLESPRYFRYGDFEEVESSIALASSLDNEDNARYMTMSQRESQYFKLLSPDPLPYSEVNRIICSDLGIELNNGRNIVSRLVSKGLAEIIAAPESGEKLIKKIQPS
jgi:hypothetical protein